MPPVVATQEIASRSQQSRVKAMRTFSPLSQPISRDRQEFRAGLGMMGAKEPAHAATQRTPYS